MSDTLALKPADAGHVSAEVEAPREALGDVQSERPAADRRGPMRPERLIPSRRRLQGEIVARAFQALDGLALLLISFGAVLRSGGEAGVFLAPALAAMLALFLAGAYRLGSGENLAAHLARTLLAVAGAALVTAPPVIFLAAAPDFVTHLAVWTATATAILGGLHIVWWSLVRRWRADGRLTPNVVVVGATPSAERFIDLALESRQVNVLGVFDDRIGRAPANLRGVPLLGGSQALLDHRIMPFVDRVIIAVPSAARDRVRQLVNTLGTLPNEIALLLDDDEFLPDRQRGSAAVRAFDVPLAHIAGPPRHGGRALAKRGVDLVIGLAALVVAAPVMAAIAIAIRLDSPGPIFFRQRRQGFNNEEIIVWKFRSMRHERADATASRQIQADDDRVTRVGRFIRRTSLDELPQIFNVLSGEMSLVGPRPHAIGMMTGDVESARLVSEYAHRHRMKPGMTGWAAIKGSRGPVDTPEDVRRRVELDVEYIERQSLWLDLYIMAVTIPCLLGDRDAVR